MKSISCELQNNSIHNGEVIIIDFSILGFKRSRDEKKVDFYYLFTNQKKEFIIVKQSFLLDKDNIDDDMAYLNHPLHEIIDMDKYSSIKKDTIKRLMEKCNATNSYYCDFVAEDIIRDITVCNGIQYTINNIQKYISFLIPMNIYLKLQMIKNFIYFKLPINVTIDRNNIYDNYRLIDVNKVTYLGSQIHNNGCINYYSLRQEKNTTGVFLPITGNFSNRIFKKELDMKKFTSLYSNSFQIDLRNLLIIDWVIDEEKKQIISIYDNTKLTLGNPIKFYLIYDNLSDSILLNPNNCF